MDINKVYIIMLKENLEAKKSFIDQQLSKLPLTKNTEIEFFDVINGRLADSNSLQKNGASHYPHWKVKTDNIWWNREMTEDETGCSLSHRAVWQKAQDEQHQTILVLEEDFFIVKDQFNVINTDIPWDLFYLGRNKIAQDCSVNEHIVRPGYSYCAYAYMLTASGIDLLLNSGFEDSIIPVDEFLASTYTTHPRNDIVELFTTKLNALALAENAISQKNAKLSAAQALSKQNEQASFEHYRPMNERLYQFHGPSTAAWLSAYVNPQIIANEFELICDEPVDNIYNFPLFSPAFCQEIIAEVEKFDRWTTDRHKHFPTTDILLNSIGLRLPVDFIIYSYIVPMIKKFFCTSFELKNVRIENFLTKYTPETQKHLSLHNDGADFTVVTHLNTEFEGGGTYFPKFKQLILPSQPGEATLHLGRFGYFHGARPVISGKRYVLVSFISIIRPSLK
jgi:collagen beta-1,O-galactosyltransferase